MAYIAKYSVLFMQLIIMINELGYIIINKDFLIKTYAY